MKTLPVSPEALNKPQNLAIELLTQGIHSPDLQLHLKVHQMNVR